MTHARSLSLLLFIIVVFAANCAAPTPVVILPSETPRGPVVPTRRIPTETPTYTPTAVPTDTLTPTATDTNTPTLTPTPSPSDTASPEPTEIALLPSDTPTDTPTITPSPTDTATLTPSPEPTATDTATITPSPTLTPTITPSPTLTPSNTPTITPSPTLTPSDTPTITPSPTLTPSATATNTPTARLMPTIALPFTPRPTLGVRAEYRFSTAFRPVDVVGTLRRDETVSAMLDDQQPALIYTFVGNAGDVVDLAMSRVTGDLDPYLMLLDPRGREIARNDDASDSTRNARLSGITLPDSGIYAVIATRFEQRYGMTSGDFTLTLAESDEPSPNVPLARETIVSELVTDTIDDDNPIRFYTFRAERGDIISLQMTADPGTNLDSRLFLTDNMGNTLAWNDDDLRVRSLDAGIYNYPIPRTGYYTIIATRFSGSDNSGGFRLKTTLEGRTPPAAGFVVASPLDTTDSRTIDERGEFYVNYSAGDVVDSSGVERRLQTLLTFDLPPLDERQLRSATFQVEPCFEQGGGFGALGALFIYLDPFGNLVRLDPGFAEPLPAAEELAITMTCTSLNVTSEVERAYAASNDPKLQVRLAFAGIVENDALDQVSFTPRLMLVFDE